MITMNFINNNPIIPSGLQLPVYFCLPDTLQILITLRKVFATQEPIVS